MARSAQGLVGQGKGIGKKKYYIRIFAIIIVVALILSSAFYNRLVIRKYTLETDKLSEGQSAKIVLVSDLHGNIYGEGQSKIISLIEKQNPDIIALAGDIADDKEPIEGTKLFLEGIRDIAPIYYVTGNHEIWSQQVGDIKKMFKSYGVKVLENSEARVVINGGQFLIGGVDDPDIVLYEKPDYDWMGEMRSRFPHLKDQSGYKIFLSHRPEFIDIYRHTPYDLVLSGHAHGGQVRVPFLLNGLYAPNQGWFPKYAGGLYKHLEFTHIISRGVSFNPKLPRVFNPPEIVVIEIIGRESQ